MLFVAKGEVLAMDDAYYAELIKTENIGMPAPDALAKELEARRTADIKLLKDLIVKKCSPFVGVRTPEDKMEFENAIQEKLEKFVRNTKLTIA